MSVITVRLSDHYGGTALLRALGEEFNHGCACPLCGHLALDIDYELRGAPAKPKLLVNCWHCRPLVDNFFDALCEAVGVPTGTALMEDEEWDQNPRMRRKDSVVAERLPGFGGLKRMNRRLLDDEAAMTWLGKKRGLSVSTIRKHRLGLTVYRGYDAIIFPVFAEGAVVGARYRFFGRQPQDRRGNQLKIMGASGHAAALYPNIPKGTGAIALCEGELDALVARQHGIPAVTTTCGTSLPEGLARRLVDRRVFVVFDAGAIDIATVTAERLRRTFGVDALPIDLAAAGLMRGEDLTDFFVTYGRSTSEFEQLIASQRRHSSRRGSQS